MALETILILRTIERALALAGGVMCVMLGYRLFIKLRIPDDGEGKLTLPGGAGFVMSRVGPGVFFAFFGALIFAAAIWRPFSYSPTNGAAASPADSTAPQDGYGRVNYFGVNPVSMNGTGSAASTLDFVAYLTDSLPAFVPRAAGASEFQVALVDLKLAILKAYWHNEWGSYDQFAHWVRLGSRDTPEFQRGPAQYFKSSK